MRLVTEKLAKGEYGQAHAVFIPTPAQFAVLAAAERQKVIGDLDRERRIEDARKPHEISIRTPEHNARMREKFAALKKNLAVKRDVEKAGNAGATDMPFTAEQRDYHSKIAALPDRSTITEEQRQEARRVARKIEAKS